MPTEAYALCPPEHLMLLRKAIDAIAKTKFIDQGNYMVVLLEGHLDVADRRLYLN